MSSTGSITNLIGRVKTGDGAAADALLAHFLPRLLGLARAKLHGKNLCAADEEDIVQSAFFGFFRGAERGQYGQCQDRHDLWHLLAKITVRKAQKLLRHEGTAGRCPPHGFAPSADQVMDQLIDPGLSPELEALAGEQVEYLLARLGNEKLITIAVLKCENYSNQEIAKLLGYSSRTIQRKIDLIRTIWAPEETQR